MDVLWDIRDRRPVDVPNEGEGTIDGRELLALPAVRRNVELDRFERAVMAMPLKARNRFMRSMQTADAIMNIARAAGRF